jgi:LAO/AO transport system kinase
MLARRAGDAGPGAAERLGAALDELVPDLFARRPRAVARALTLVEGGGPAQRALVRRIYRDSARGDAGRGDAGRARAARVVGVTGPPGAGKSTLVDRLARLCRARGETVGILAVDPTSPYSGGALLGDRIRMQSLYLDPGVFIRSMATRGAMGGLARATHDAIDVLAAAGFDWVVVETVGVGQDEVDVVRAVDTVVVVTVPGLGDDIQAIKAGLMEIADVFVINKADREGADRTARDLAAMVALAEDGAAWRPPIVKTVATREEGIAEVLARAEEHRRRLAEGGGLADRRRAQLRLRVETILKDHVLAEAGASGGLDREVERGLAERLDPYAVAERLFAGVVDPSVGV